MQSAVGTFSRPAEIAEFPAVFISVEALFSPGTDSPWLVFLSPILYATKISLPLNLSSGSPGEAQGRETGLLLSKPSPRAQVSAISLSRRRIGRRTNMAAPPFPRARAATLPRRLRAPKASSLGGLAKGGGRRAEGGRRGDSTSVREAKKAALLLERASGKRFGPSEAIPF